MRNTMRWTIAAAAALVFTPSARPCDARAYDPKDDAPREQACPPEVVDEHRAELPRAERSGSGSQTKGAAPEGSGAGSGEPKAAEDVQQPMHRSWLDLWNPLATP